jgi:hypothetical protein
MCFVYLHSLALARIDRIYIQNGKLLNTKLCMYKFPQVVELSHVAEC